MSDPVSRVLFHAAWCQSRQGTPEECNCGVLEAIGHYRTVLADRDRLLLVLERIATDHDCDPREEARAALEGKP